MVKYSADVAKITTGMKSQAMTIYPVESVVEKYMQCIEEIINIPTLHKHFTSTVKQGYLDQVLDEIILQSKVEFNYSLSEESDEDDSNE
ncbi:hypothetical protein H8D29_06810 [PVC group bacterium]|nr:hypothetical protein [PVC group bacterium]